MGLIQRIIEQAGISTVSISIKREITEKVKPPRAVYLHWPLGHPMGEPFNEAQHRRILMDALKAAESVTVPGTIIDLPYRWRRETYTNGDQENTVT